MISNANSEFLQPVEPEDFLPPIGQWATLGGLVLLVGFSAAVTLASVLTYKVTVKAPATVRPAGELRIVQATREGTVKSIAVKENQLVKQGDAITYIDDSRLQTQKNQLQTNIRQNQRQLTQIDAQIRTVDIQVSAEGNRIRRTIASAQAELSSIKRDYQDKQITTQAQVKEAEAALELATEELTRYQKLANTGAIAQLQIKEREAALKTATARLQRVKTALNPTAAPVTAAKEQIAREQAAGEAALATLRREREMLVQRLIEIQNQIERDRQELQQIETELTHTIIEAPTDGTIFQLNLRNPGQFLRPTDTVAQIAPNHNFLVIKSLVQTQERDKIAVGEEVEMRIEACPYPNFGTLKGTVTEISADAVAPAITSNAATAYEVTIQPASLSLKFGRHECTLKPGMEGRADIIAREETILTFILRQARLLTDF